MFTWLWRLVGGGGAAHVPAAGARAEGRDGSRQIASKPAAQRERYLETLRRQAGRLAPLTAEEERLTSELVERVVGHLRRHTLDPPVMPALASRMLELLRAEDVDAVALARLVEQDQATAAKLLTIANSALFSGQHHEVQTVRDAVVLLGTEEVARVAIALASRSLFEGPGHGARFRRLFAHAMTTAFAACQLATQRSRRHSDAAFLGGLFHDVGKAVALRAISELERTSPVEEREVVLDAALHMVHAEPSCVLYESWKLPRQLMTICRTHHRLGPERPPELAFVRLVSGLDVLREGSALEKREALIEIEESAAVLKLSDPELRVAHTETRDYAERVARMFA